MNARSTSPFSTRRVEAHGLGVHIRDWPGAPPPVVMLHGLGFTGRMFDPIARVLSPRHHVICPDFRGHGRTDHPPEGYQYPNLVRDLMGVLQMLRLPRVVLVGHTWGADVAMTFAAAHPRRVAGLVLIDGGFRHRREIPGNDQPPTPDQSKSSDRFPSIDAALEDARVQLGIPWTADIQGAIEDSLDVGRDKRVRYRLDDHRWRQIYKALWAYDPSPHLSNVQTPTLLVHPAGPAPSSPQGSVAAFQARAAALLMHDAELLRLPDVDNLSLLANPELATTIGAFLQRLPMP